MKPILAVWLIASCLLLLSACVPSNAGRSAPQLVVITEPPVERASATPSGTAVVSLPQFTYSPSPSATPKPLNIVVENTLTPVPSATSASSLPIVFSTEGATPESAWRPPLYPTPWALSPYDHFYFTRPFASNVVSWPIADYRYGGIFFRPEVVHTGIDLPADVGTPVQATGSGTVVWAGWGLLNNAPNYKDDPYGMAVAIRHDFGYKDQPLFTIYAHLSEVDVAVGQVLEVGDVLGKVGTTGFTTGPHLHYEIRVGANDFFSTRNPEFWLVPPEGWGVLVARIMDTYQRPLTSHEIIVRSQATQRAWIVKTYGGIGANSDPYYNENLVLSDLPAGVYQVNVPYAGLNNR
ncbi:MAG: M23 family metallopeptidase, partial [Anaerolineales bacterium]|nr:M23 family metallopeptidase [Anaerolineales bacterium]